MSVLLAAESHSAVQALQCAQAYDILRLETYRKKENLTKRIRIKRFGTAVALRFDDVGYFNRVYCSNEAAFDRLPEIEDFYWDCQHGCELVGPPALDGAVDRHVISRFGWKPGHQFAWMHARDIKAFLPRRAQGNFEIREPEPAQREHFLLTYLRAFEAQEERIPAAVRNMRHLFDCSELSFLLAWHGDVPAGIGMMMRDGSSILLCAGAVLPAFRHLGCHAALLAARIRLAAEIGVEELFSWTALGGQSQSNMERAGLCPVGITRTWRFQPEPR